MVRRQTWIVLVIFILLLAVVFYLQKNPPPSSASLTPSATSAPKVLAGWNSSDITWMETKTEAGKTLLIEQDATGNWFLGDGKGKVETGLAEEIRTNIAEIRAVTALPGNSPLDVVGLNSSTPTRTLTIRNKAGKQTVIRIGNTTPTGSGYYIQVDSEAPVVVDKSTIDGTLDLFNNALPTPTPEPGTPPPAQ
jgi:hypothetical protein